MPSLNEPDVAAFLEQLRAADQDTVLAALNGAYVDCP